MMDKELHEANAVNTGRVKTRRPTAGLRQALRAREMAGAVECAAVIHGGRMEGKRRQHYGVWLDVPDDLLDEAARAPAPRVARKRGCGCWPFGVLPVALAGALLLLLL